MIIDAHVHVSQKQMGDIFDTCKKVGIDKICLFGRFDLALKYYRQQPDMVVPIAQIYMDSSDPSIVDKMVELGMKGLKVNGPLKPYHHEAYFPFYAKAEYYDLPIVFHTGISNRKGSLKSAVNMQPIFLDDIGRRFQRLRMVMAHLGNPWYEDGAAALRYNQNMVCDLSGSTLKKKTAAELRALFWWDKPGHPYAGDGDKHPFDKIIFGTDVPPEWVQDTFDDYQRLMDDMEVPEEYRKKIMGETAAEFFRLD